MSNNVVIIVISSLIILSFFFSMLAKKTQIPSVILLIGAGFGIRISPWFGSLDSVVDVIFTLNILGVIGLIMIVLEAAVDLKLSRDRLPEPGGRPRAPRAGEGRRRGRARGSRAHALRVPDR